MNIFTCKACSAKDAMISYLKDELSKKDPSCNACTHLERINTYLVDLVEKFRQMSRSERAEYKRAVDVLLVSQDKTPIMQGPEPEPGKPSKPMDISMMNMFKEVEAPVIDGK